MSVFSPQPVGFDPKQNNSIPPKVPANIDNGKSSDAKGNPPIRVLIVDDHEIVRRGMHTILANNPLTFEVCGEASNGVEAIEMARKVKPDVVVIDVSMPGLNGIEATRMILKELPGVEVLVLTMHDSETLIEELLRAGAKGYLLKTDLSRELPVAIDSLYRKRPFFSAKVARKVLDGYLGYSSRVNANVVLTPAERRVLQFLAEGKSNKEVANALNISVKTAETHRANIMRKLGLRSMSDLVHYAVRNEIIEP
jgi:DNA-binding NarL/FixJ family response regulator